MDLRPLASARPWLRRAFAVCVAWPICLVVLGMNIRHRNRLPLKGPVIVTPNHNSHADDFSGQRDAQMGG